MPEVAVTTEVDAPVKFGIDQIVNPTPKSVKNVFRWVLYAAALANLILQIVTEIPEPVRAIVAKYSLYAVTLVHGISKLFGVDISEVENPIFKRNQNSSI